MPAHTEHAFESAIEAHPGANGWFKGAATEFMRASALRPARTGVGGGVEPIGEAPSAGRGESKAPAGKPDSNRGEFSGDRGELAPDRGELNTGADLPEDVRRMLRALGPKPRKERLRPLIVRLCALRAWQPAELARLLRFADPEKLVERHLSPMVADLQLARTHPETPNHPEQAYRATQGSLDTGD